MKIEFEEGGFVEIRLSMSPGKVNIVLGAVDAANPLKKIINSAEIELKELAQMIQDLEVPLPLVNNNSSE